MSRIEELEQNGIPVSGWTPDDTARAEAYWADYQTTHDISDRIGQIAGIDPKTGRIWFGTSVGDVAEQRDATGVDQPLLFLRVGGGPVYRRSRTELTPAQATELRSKYGLDAPPWNPEDTNRAQELWAVYQQTHDVTDRFGQAVGIDPKSGRVWFGESAVEVVQNRDADGVDAPLFVTRVGYGYYQRKGSCR